MTISGAAQAPAAPMKKTVGCALKSVAVATATGRRFPAKAAARSQRAVHGVETGDLD